MQTDWHTVRQTPDGRFVVVAPDGLTWLQLYPHEQLVAADQHCSRLNEPTWWALKPRYLRVDRPDHDPGDVLLALIDRSWLFEGGPPLERPFVFDQAVGW